MCEKCNELRKRFQETESITERQSFWREYNKQRKKCEGNLGILAPKKGKAEVTVQEKKRKKKTTEEPAKTQTPETKPEHKKSAKETSNTTASQKKEPPTIKPIIATNSTHCKYLYRGGLCANSKMDKPFCPCEGSTDKCPLNEEKK